MKFRKTRATVPAAARGEYLIANAGTTSGDEVVATDHALYRGPDQRIPWSTISRAEWQEPNLTVTLLDASGRPAERLRLELAAPAQALAAAVHDRVTASVVISERVEIDEMGSALITARRNRDDDTITWAVLFDAGIDPDDPRVRGQAEEAVGRMRASLGI